jgi:hypothetical protein
MASPVSASINGMQTQLDSCVDISWSLHNSPSEVYRNMRFYVVDSEISSFDAALSEESARKYGIMGVLDVGYQDIVIFVLCYQLC